MKSTRADSDPRAAATGFDEPPCTIEGTRGRVHTVDGQRYSVEIAGRHYLVTLVHEGVANAAAAISVRYAHVGDLQHVSVPQWREQQYTGYCAVESGQKPERWVVAPRRPVAGQHVPRVSDAAKTGAVKTLCVRRFEPAKEQIVSLGRVGEQVEPR